MQQSIMGGELKELRKKKKVLTKRETNYKETGQ